MQACVLVGVCLTLLGATRLAGEWSRSHTSTHNRLLYAVWTDPRRLELVPALTSAASAASVPIVIYATHNAFFTEHSAFRRNIHRQLQLLPATCTRASLYPLLAQRSETADWIIVCDADVIVDFDEVIKLARHHTGDTPTMLSSEDGACELVDFAALSRIAAATDTSPRRLAVVGVRVVRPTSAFAHPSVDAAEHILFAHPHHRRLSAARSVLVPKSIPAYVVSMKGPITLPAVFHPVSLVVPRRFEPVDFLTAGEVSYRDAMRSALTDAVERGLETFATFDEDILVSKRFDAQWRALDRFATPGIAQLGGTVWSDSVWSRLERVDASWIRGASGIYGSFAVLWSHESARATLEWMRYTDGLYPFDHAFPYLAHLNHTWRVAHPPMVVMQTNKVSSVDPSRSRSNRRFHIHRWGAPTDYARPIPGPRLHNPSNSSLVRL